VHVLGIDIGGSGIKGAPVDISTGSLSADRYRIQTPQPATPQKVAKAVGRIAAHFEWTGPIGCTLPARVQHGVAHTATNIHKSWIDTAVDALFSSQTGLPVRVLNDADAAGVASMAFGAGKDRTDLVLMLTVGTGIGSALFINRQLVPNTELGHLDLDGRNAELFCSDRARKRDGLSWKQWAKRFQVYLDTVEFLFAPDLIILGGGISRASKVSKYLRYLSTRAELVPSILENEAGIIGAAYAARDLAAGSG
jgi:polyphosphate glucokinase